MRFQQISKVMTIGFAEQITRKAAFVHIDFLQLTKIRQEDATANKLMGMWLRTYHRSRASYAGRAPDDLLPARVPAERVFSY
jgi:hypothetical protein